jgi:hypothetical protein
MKKKALTLLGKITIPSILGSKQNACVRHINTHISVRPSTANLERQETPQEKMVMR